MKFSYKLIELIAAIVLFILLSFPATIFNLVSIRKKNKKYVWTLFRTLKILIVELVEIVFDLFEILAVVIDRIGNIIIGDLIEYCITKERDTTFGMSEWTISASIGKLLVENKLNKFGLSFDRFLSKIFGKDHCSQAYKFHLIKQEFKSKTGIS